MRALVTGFNAFGGDSINPSFEAVRRLPARIGKLDVVTAELPTSFARASRKLLALIARVQPDIVLGVGLAADRPAISVERIAVNLSDARIADNDGVLTFSAVDLLRLDGVQPREKPVIARAPDAYFSTLPVTNIVDALGRAGLRAEISMSAGTFVCNHVFYVLMHAAAKGNRAVRAGFVHVPALPVADPVRALADLVRALAIVLRVTQRSMKVT